MLAIIGQLAYNEEIKNWSALDLDMLFAGADWCYVYDRGKTTLQIMKNHYVGGKESGN